VDPHKVLIVDDDRALAHVLGAQLAQAGYEARLSFDARAALASLRSEPLDLVITDLRMPGADGFALLDQIKRKWADIPVVMLTAHGDVPTAVAAMREGASDFLLKPFERAAVIATVARTLARSALGSRKHSDVGRSAPIGASEAWLELTRQATRAAQGSATVLLRGESGTGKESLALLIHERSTRAGRPFVVADLAAIPESLIESELFGHERGAFTGASTRKPGRVEQAEGGSLFLDEVGELTPSAQVKLLRLLQESSYFPLGATRARRADVRFIAATHRNLEEMLADGRFREDLYYRLNVIPLRVPPLRERGSEDLRTLAQHFATSFARLHGQAAPRFSEDAWSLLAQHPWPGNIRELQNLIERLTILRAGENVSAAVVREELAGAPVPETPADPEQQIALAPCLHAAERAAISAALEKASGNRSLAARMLGISRRSLYNKLGEHGLASRSRED
jgi:two-component system, NtrC family, response regulator AtoC